jgi:hypothetical protein
MSNDDGIAIAMPPELLARIRQWAVGRDLGFQEAIHQLLDRGLRAPESSSPPKPRRGKPVHWGDGRYILLHGLVLQIQHEMESKRKPHDPAVSVKRAIRALRARHENWEKYPEETLEARFYDAQRRLEKISRELDDGTLQLVT